MSNTFVGKRSHVSREEGGMLEKMKISIVVDRPQNIATMPKYIYIYISLGGLAHMCLALPYSNISDDTCANLFCSVVVQTLALFKNLLY